MKVAFDVGNSTTAIAADNGRVLAWPSLVLDDPFGGSYGVRMNGSTYAVGDDARDRNGVRTVQSWQHDRYASDATVSFVLTGLYELYGNVAGQLIDVAFGLPVEYMDALAPRVVQRLSGILAAPIHGVEHSFTIRRVHIYGEGQELIRLVPNEYRNNKIIIIDSGSRTTNVVLFDGLRKPNGITFPFGATQFHRLITAHAGAGDETEIYDLAKSLVGRKDKAMREDFGRAAAALARLINAKLRISPTTNVFLSGGLAELLVDGLARELRHTVKLLARGDDLTTANARAGLLALKEAS